MDIVVGKSDPKSYLESVLQGEPRLPPSPLAWLNSIRSSALEQAGMLKMPTTRDEEWRFTDISPLTRLSFQPAPDIPALQKEDIAHFYLDEAFATLVFVDGRYMPGLSTEPEDGGAGLVVTSLREALPTYGEEIEPHLGRHAAFEGQIFTALNTAF